jgi:hypothetical protein
VVGQRSLSPGVPVGREGLGVQWELGQLPAVEVRALGPVPGVPTGVELPPAEVLLGLVVVVPVVVEQSQEVEEEQGVEVGVLVQQPELVLAAMGEVLLEEVVVEELTLGDFLVLQAVVVVVVGQPQVADLDPVAGPVAAALVALRVPLALVVVAPAVVVLALAAVLAALAPASADRSVVVGFGFQSLATLRLWLEVSGTVGSQRSCSRDVYHSVAFCPSVAAVGHRMTAQKVADAVASLT